MRDRLTRHPPHDERLKGIPLGSRELGFRMGKNPGRLAASDIREQKPGIERGRIDPCRLQPRARVREQVAHAARRTVRHR